MKNGYLESCRKRNEISNYHFGMVCTTYLWWFWFDQNPLAKKENTTRQLTSHTPKQQFPKGNQHPPPPPQKKKKTPSPRPKQTISPRAHGVGAPAAPCRRRRRHRPRQPPGHRFSTRRRLEPRPGSWSRPSDLPGRWGKPRAKPRGEPWGWVGRMSGNFVGRIGGRCSGYKAAGHVHPNQKPKVSIVKVAIVMVRIVWFHIHSRIM